MHIRSKCDDQRLETMRVAFNKRYLDTDKEFINNFIERGEDPVMECDDDGFLITPFSWKEITGRPKLSKKGGIEIEEEKRDYDLILDRVEKIKIEPFSFSKESKKGEFDKEGNYIPKEEKDKRYEMKDWNFFIPYENEEEEEEADDEDADENDGQGQEIEPEPEDDGIIFDMNLALESFRILLCIMVKSENVAQCICRMKDDQDKLSYLTTAASQLQFMGLENIYQMKKKEIIKHYNQLNESVHVDQS